MAVTGADTADGHLVTGGRRRIVHAHDSIRFGGMEVYLLDLLERLGGRGHAVWLLVPGSRDPDRASPPELVTAARRRGITVLRPPEPIGRAMPAPAREVLGARALIRSVGAEIVHVHTCRPVGGRKATLAGRAAGCRVVRTEHCAPTLFGGPDPGGPVIRMVDRLTSTIITVSDDSRREQVEVVGRSPEQVVASRIGIDTAAIRPGHDAAVAKRSLGLDPERVVVGAVGRLATVKGHDVLVDAMALIAAARPDVDLLLVGDGERRADLERRVADRGLTGRVRFVGHQVDVAGHVRAMDVTVLPSRSEGLPLTLLEYMAHAKASVVTAHPAILEAAGDTAVAVPIDDPAAIAAAVEGLLRDPRRARELGARARRRVETHFDVEAHVDHLVGIYDRIVAGAIAGRGAGGRRDRAGRTAAESRRPDTAQHPRLGGG